MDLFGPSFFFPSEAFLALRTRFDFFFFVPVPRPQVGTKLRWGPGPEPHAPLPAHQLFIKKIATFYSKQLISLVFILIILVLKDI